MASMVIIGVSKIEGKGEGSAPRSPPWCRLELRRVAQGAVDVGRAGGAGAAEGVADVVVAHAASGRSAGFGELAADAAKIAPPENPTLKDPRAFTLIGTDRVRRKDSAAKSTGTARFTQDVRLPDMLTAVVAHARQSARITRRATQKLRKKTQKLAKN